MMRIFICGDSTAAAYDPGQTPIVGWGQALAEMMPETEVRNHAMAGRSTRTFLAEGRLDRLDGELRPGDLLLIQFGHNDEGNKPERHTDPWTDFSANLETFVRFARDRGAQPVLMTPICIRLWENGVLQGSHGEYLKAVRAAADRLKVPLIDLYQESFRIVSEAGEEASRAFYKGPFIEGSSENPDNTHTRREGAERFARRVREALKNMNLKEEKSMERFAWKGRIRPGMQEEYKRRHDEIWPEMLALLKDAGIRNYSIWSDGRDVFGYYECEKGIAFAEKTQAGSPIVDKWNEYMDDVLELVMDPETGAQPRLRQMFMME